MYSLSYKDTVLASNIIACRIQYQLFSFSLKIHFNLLHFELVEL